MQPLYHPACIPCQRNGASLQCRCDTREVSVSRTASFDEISRQVWGAKVANNLA